MIVFGNQFTPEEYLLSQLTQTQKATYPYGYFEVVIPHDCQSPLGKILAGSKFQIRRGYMQNIHGPIAPPGVFSMRARNWCAVCDIREDMPLALHMLAQKLVLEIDPQRFFDVAVA